MFRVGFLITVAMLSAFSGAQTTRLITPRNPVVTGWEMEPKLKHGVPLKLRFELRPKGAYVDGPSLSVPCLGPSEEANMKGWRDGATDYSKLAADSTLRPVISTYVAKEKAMVNEAVSVIRHEETRVETEITQMYSVRPGEGGGPRKTQDLYRYRYQKMELYLLIAGEKFDFLMGSFYVPMADPVLLSSRNCGEPPTPERYGTLVSGLIHGQGFDEPLPSVTRAPMGYIGAVFSPETAGALKDSGFGLIGDDFDEITVREGNFTDSKIKFVYLPPGTILIPNKNSAQTMITTDSVVLRAGTFQVSLDDDQGTRSVAVHCLEIEKAPPDPSVTFTPGVASDPTLRNLANFTQRSAIRGPWDQARMWIYTDKASLERINKRLAIGCPPGMYVRSLWEVQTMAGLTDEDLKNPELLAPALLGGVSNRKEAANWFAGALARHQTEALIKYLSGGGKELADLMTSSNPLAQDQFVRTMNLLRTAGSPAVRLAMLKFLDAQDAAVLKKAVGKPTPDWDRHIAEAGEEADLGTKLKAKFAA